MKKIVSMIILSVLCLCLLCSCDESVKKTDTETLMKDVGKGTTEFVKKTGKDIKKIIDDSHFMEDLKSGKLQEDVGALSNQFLERVKEEIDKSGVQEVDVEALLNDIGTTLTDTVEKSKDVLSEADYADLEKLLEDVDKAISDSDLKNVGEILIQMENMLEQSELTDLEGIVEESIEALKELKLVDVDTNVNVNVNIG